MKEASYKRPHIVWFHLSEMSRRGKSIGTESRLVVTRGWGGGVGQRKLGVITKRFELSFGGDENVLKLDAGDGCTTLWIY